MPLTFSYNDIILYCSIFVNYDIFSVKDMRINE